jgi:hypothetical protein
MGPMVVFHLIVRVILAKFYRHFCLFMQQADGRFLMAKCKIIISDGKLALKFTALIAVSVENHGRNNHICRVCHDIPSFSATYVAMHDDIPTFCQQLSVDSIII